MILTKEYILNNLYTKNNKLNSNMMKNIVIPKEYYWCNSNKEYIYCILNDINNIPLCLNCNSNKKNFYNNKYHDCCSIICTNKYSNNKINKILTKEYILNNLYTKNNKLNSNMMKNIVIPKEYYWCNFAEEYLNCILNDINNPIKCKCCNNFVKYKKNGEYHIFCSTKCANNDIEKQNQRKITSLEKYGYEHPMNNDLLKNKIKQTKLEKYGNENYNNFEKNKKTIINKYGVDNYSKTNEYKIKIKKTNNLLYKVDSYSQINIKNKNEYDLFLSGDFDIISKFIDSNNDFLILKFQEYFNIKSHTTVNYIKNKLNILNNNKTNLFKTQKEIFNYIKENLNINNLIFNDKLLINKELDIVINNKIAIEYNGLMFHSFGISKHSMFNNYYNEVLNKNNHLIKTELCEEKGIKLFHIFENEWLDPIKQNIWKSMIHNSLQLIDNKIYARKCIIKEISFKEKNFFLNNNHLQSDCNSSINLGLYFENELVSVMTFGKSRYNKIYEYELYRFCNLINTNVVGAFSKLLKYFEKKYNPKSIISYGNRRWTNIDKNVYKTNNFILDHISKPNFFYFNNKYILHSRIVFQKHKVELKLKDFNSTLSTIENIYNNGYRKIYDSGNLVYVLKR